MSFQLKGSRDTAINSKFKALSSYLLGSRYDLSVAFLSAAEMRAVTRRTKKRNTASNVLSFPLSKASGEILLCRATARTQAPLYGMKQREFIAYLFIHGLLHLKGLKHGATMEQQERKILARFGFALCKKSSQASMSARTTSK